MQPGFEIIGAKSKKGGGEEPPAHAPMAPRGPGRTSLSGDQKKVRRQMAKSAGAIDTIESMLSGLEPDQLQELWDLASEEQRKATDRKTQDAIATARGAIMRQFQKWGMEPVVASKVAASDFQGGGMLHALWIKIIEWIIGHNGYSDYADEYAFASLRPQGNKETTVDTSIQREAALLNEMDGASLDRQREIATELEAIGRARTAAWETDREIDFGGAVVRDTLTPVVTAAVHTSSTDWLDEVAPERDLAEVQRAMTAAASGFYTRVHEGVKAEPEEYRIQAEGMARLVAGAHAPFTAEATDAFMRHALFLNRSAVPHAASLHTAVTLTDGNIESEAERVAEEARDQAWGDILNRPGDEIEEMVDDICARRYPGDPLAKDVADQAINIVMSGSKHTAAAQVRCSKCGTTKDAATAKAQDDAGWGCASESGVTGKHDWKPVKEAADADINPYPAHDQAGYAESGLPASVPVEGYEADGISGDGAFENFAPTVAPENVEAEAQEGDRTPMPGFGEQVTSAVDAGMRSVDTPLWGFQTVAQQQKAAPAAPSRTAASYGEMASCKVCGSDIQYLGDGWYDRGSNTYCDESGQHPLIDGGDGGYGDYPHVKHEPYVAAVRRTARRISAASTQEALGFSSIEALTVEGDNRDMPNLMAKAINGAALSRGIKVNAPSDALDMSRDIILDEAAATLGCTWEISGDTLRIWPLQYGHTWPIKEGSLHTAVRTHINWQQGVAPSGAEFFKANVDGYDIDVRPLREGEGEPGWWTWSVTGNGDNGPRNKHGQAADRDEAEEIALGIVDNQDGFTMESGMASRRTAAINWTLTHEEPNWVTDDGDVAATPNGTIPMEYVAKVPEGELRVYNVIGGWLWQINGKNPNAAPLVEFNGANGDPFGPRDGLDLDEAKMAVERAYAAWSGKRASKTAGVYCKTHKVWVGDGNAATHTDCSKEQRATDKTAATTGPWYCKTCNGQIVGGPETGWKHAGPAEQGHGETADKDHQAAPGGNGPGGPAKTAGTDPDDQAGTAESGSSTPETNSETMWPWELPDGETKSGQDAANVAAVPTPGSSEADYPQPKGASRNRAIEPTEAVQAGDTVRVIGGFEDGVTGKVTRGGWHESRAYGYTVASNNAFAAYYIDVAGTEIGPFRSGDIEKV